MRISEIFGPVIQGEGVSAGIPAFFVRLSGCNLMCGGPNGKLVDEGLATWWCDSEAIWKDGKDWTNDEIIKFFKDQGELDRILEGTTRVIITGGEPTTSRNQRDIVGFIGYLKLTFPYSTLYFELETNGTNFTGNFYDKYIHQVNCSPKLANSGLSREVRIKPDALKEINSHKNSWFKFVISNEWDWNEIERDFLPYIDKEKIVLMPAGSTTEDLKPTLQVAWGLATKHNVRLCGRYQVYAWEKTVGV